ncbi:fungal-specific transcription factor domain-containing protein [Aspergillus granulosus]|uniref:Fungal-specific transcription factor domain-containing protein n=1 Tax=Aspergillus granulosus TaxID=176169 RepID=A0ABR4HAM5_9EURO
MAFDPGAPRARASCSRCHRRKKRCDRSLPMCNTCRSARLRCSFQDDEGQTASYPVAYVPDTSSPMSAEAFGEEINFNNFQAGDGTLEGNTAVAHNTEPSITDLQPPTFAEELKNLSLEATAERHLGSTSGLSFAKLTQMVLRRLTPDKADFVFVNDQENTDGASFFNLTSPSDIFNDSIFQSMSESISIHPLLFGDLFLADITGPDSSLDNLAWPSDEAHVQRLIDFYFAHSHTLYPIVKRSEVMRTLDRIRGNPQRLGEQSPLEIFRIWMVLAIGSTAFSSVSLTEESESRTYYSKALQYSELALGNDDMSALEVIMLQVSYSFFNQLGPRDTWFLVGLAARLALGMGLHTSSTYDGLPVDVQERYKRVFFSVYMMDRVVSVALGRPFALHDDDIDVTPFAPADDDTIYATGITPQSTLQPSIMAVPLHILALRRIASKISRTMYPNRKAAVDITPNQHAETIHSLHQDLLTWRRNMPFPLPDTHPSVPHLTTLWYDFNYYTHLAMIYRPTPTSPTMDPARVKTLENAACMALRQAFAMHQQLRFAYNWLNFLALFTCTISLIYAVTAQPGGLGLALRSTRVIEDLELAMALFERFGGKFLAARRVSGMVGEVVRRYDRRVAYSTSPPLLRSSSSLSSASTKSTRRSTISAFTTQGSPQFTTL